MFKNPNRTRNSKLWLKNYFYRGVKLEWWRDPLSPGLTLVEVTSLQHKGLNPTGVRAPWTPPCRRPWNSCLGAWWSSSLVKSHPGKQDQHSPSHWPHQGLREEPWPRPSFPQLCELLCLRPSLFKSWRRTGCPWEQMQEENGHTSKNCPHVLFSI